MKAFELHKLSLETFQSFQFRLVTKLKKKKLVFGLQDKQKLHFYFYILLVLNTDHRGQH